MADLYSDSTENTANSYHKHLDEVEMTDISEAAGKDSP